MLQENEQHAGWGGLLFVHKYGCVGCSCIEVESICVLCGAMNVQVGFPVRKC